MMMKKLIFISLVFLTAGCENGEIKEQKDNWSVQMADAVMARYDSLIYYNDPGKVKWQYDIAMLGQAIDKLGSVDHKYSEYMEGFYNYFIQEDGTIKVHKPGDYKLDDVNPAKGLITLYKRTGEEKYMVAIESIIEMLKSQPRTEEGGYWHKKIYPEQMWLDGIYMAAPYMAQYAREFNQPRWYEEVARQLTLAYKNTLDPATGLLYHAHDASHEQQWSDPATGQSKEFWGRAMGWYMMALVDVLDYYPENHHRKSEIINILHNVSEALLQVRDEETGLWYQVLDKGGQPGNYLEASCSNMFTYAFAKGASNGYLPEKYLDIARQSFQNILDEFVVMDDQGMPVLKKTCGAAGLGGDPYRAADYEYYIHEKIVDNDPKGVAPFILAAIELGY